MLTEGCRVVVDVITDNCIPKAGSEGVVHSLGLRSVSAEDGLVEAVSNWVPSELSGEIALDDLFPHVAQINEPPRERFPFNDCNVVVLPR